MKRTALSAAVLVGLAGLATSGWAADAATREVHYGPVGQLEKRPEDLVWCGDGEREEFHFRFPVEGGPITDLRWKQETSFLVASGDSGLSLPDLSNLDCQTDTYTGQLVVGAVKTGTDFGVAMKVRFRHQEGATHETDVRGELPESGTGTLRVLGKDGKVQRTLTVKYPPYSRQCVPNLDAYDDKVRGYIIDQLQPMAAKHVHGMLMRHAQKLWEKVHAIHKHWEYATDRYQYRYRSMVTGARMPPDNLYQKIAAKIVPDKAGKIPALPILDDVIGKFGDIIGGLEVGAAVLDGDAFTAGYKSATMALGMYSNAVGLTIMFGEAAHADWERFAKGNYEKQFRTFYEELYYQGDHPSSAKAKKSRQARLKDFMEEIMARLHAGGTIGGGGQAQLRKMIMEYAHYRLGMNEWTRADSASLSRGEFEVEEAPGGRYRFVHRHIQPILVNLFRDFERTYANDLRAVEMRRIAKLQTKALKRAAVEAQGRLVAVEDKHFNKAWTNLSAYEKAFCSVVANLQSKGLLATP